MNKKRADLILVEKKIASSRTQAQDLIKSGKAFYLKANEKIKIEKPSEELSDELTFEIEKSEGEEFVSRAGNKLSQAIKELQLDLSKKNVLDVGVSTGGFSDCVLKLGATRVIGVEVGHGQTVKQLLENPRFQLFEGVNARYLSTYTELISKFPQDGFDFIVMDVSFISIKLILPELWPYLNDQGRILTLVKPQFELGPENLNRSGIIKNINLYPKLEKDMVEFASTNRFEVLKYFPSNLPGKEGNKEFFMYLKKDFK
jgi:23S rRNA (cytidine1920-2'-O)/16S rRNA (cytidine1409-2'-O)-methyltransferase